MEPPEVPDLQHITLPSKPDCPIAYTFTTLHPAHSASHTNAIWLIFINGLGLPQAHWQPTLTLLQSDPTNSLTSPLNTTIYTTTYDRYGQGLSRPIDNSLPKLHDITDSTADLHDFLSSIRQKHLPHHNAQNLKRIIVAHSIGVPLARLYLAQSQQATSTAVSAALFLDSNLASIDMATLLPDPDAPTFQPNQLPPDTTLDDLTVARQNYTRLFAPSAPNAENLDRTTLPSLLPRSDVPIICSAGETPFKLVVVAHDPDTFAEESLRISTRGLTERYVEPAWRAYNLGLCALVGGDDVVGTARLESGVVVARGSGHFVQKDNPRCVADQIWELVGQVLGQ